MNNPMERGPILPPEMRVDEAEEKSLDRAPRKREVQIPEEIRPYAEEGQRMIDGYKRMFTTFAKDVSLDFKMSDGFYIDLEAGEVNLNTKWFAEKGFSPEQIRWAVLHELSHFRDLAEDPERMMQNFEYIRAKAKETGALIFKKWQEKYGASDPDFVEDLGKQTPVSKKDPSKTMSAVEQAAYTIHHTFYNIFDDIFVNNLVSRKADFYGKDMRGGEEVEDLYREKLFRGTDYTKTPRHLQFTYALLRGEMVPDEEVAVSDEVKEALASKVVFLGRSYTPRELVDTLLKPGMGRDARAGERYSVLKRTIEPVFMELLRRDLDEWNPQRPEKQGGGKGEGSGEAGEPQQGESAEGEPQEGEQGGEPQEGAGNPFDQSYKEFKENSPDQIGGEDIDAWFDKHKEGKKEEEKREAERKKEESKTGEERAKESQNALDEVWCVENRIAPETLKRFREIEREIAPYLADLAVLWRRIVFGSSKGSEREVEGHFKTGTELDIGKVVEEWPRIERGDTDEVRVMKKTVQKEALVRKPELIRVRLVGDMSGSMDEGKKRVLRQCFALILSSIAEFNRYLNLNRSETKTKLRADTEAWVFGDDARRAKRFRDAGISDEYAETVRAFEHLESTIGGTYDDTALSAIGDSLTAQDRTRIEQGKTMEIVLEVTDGGSSNKEAAREAVDRLADMGVIARAFQVGVVGEDDRKIFNKVWNDKRAEGFGTVVGENIGNLLPALTELLKKYLGSVQL